MEGDLQCDNLKSYHMALFPLSLLLFPREGLSEDFSASSSLVPVKQLTPSPQERIRPSGNCSLNQRC